MMLVKLNDDIVCPNLLINYCIWYGYMALFTDDEWNSSTGIPEWLLYDLGQSVHISALRFIKVTGPSGKKCVYLFIRYCRQMEIYLM